MTNDLFGIAASGWIGQRRRRLHGGDGGDCPRSQKVIAPKSPHRNFVKSLSPFLHVGVWFNPFPIKVNKLANISRTMYSTACCI